MAKRKTEAAGLTKKELKLVSMMLERLYDTLSNNGCNDLPDEWRALFTSDELIDLQRQHHEHNGDPEDNPGDGNVAGFSLVGFMAHRLSKLAEVERV